eukprot:c8738_g1_i1.p1 GENE.c8738_g1_i1~~c8738_g1_i1.p1  ORF type:complete len:440 (+),score=92.86 c8738_g1_i1:316-1635(+)
MISAVDCCELQTGHWTQATLRQQNILSHRMFGFPAPSARVEILKEKLLSFMNEHIYPAEKVYASQRSQLGAWQPLPIIEDLKAKAKEQGLWNLFMPVETDGGKYGAGLTNLEYAPLCEIMGRSIIASEVFNCSAPDTGNMEVLARFGTPAQIETWLKPLLNGEIRSCYGMTEPAVASSDATNIQCQATRVGDEYVIQGKKWWASGAGDPRCKLCVLMCKTGDGSNRHTLHSMILVPMDSPGVQIKRALTVFGYDDSPHGHMEVAFDKVRVPITNIVLGEGRGFEIAQARLGPGRIHHCMRTIGTAERCLELACTRALQRTAFNQPLAKQGVIREMIAESRMEIDQARLYVMNAAHKMDCLGNKAARAEIHAIKVIVPNMGCRVIDRAIQIHGGAGVSQDFILAYAYASIRTLRIADGPDEVHRVVVARTELSKYTSSKL